MIAIRNVSSSAQARDQYCGDARCSMREAGAFGPPGGAGGGADGQVGGKVEESQRVIGGGQEDHKEHHYLYRGIAARQFQRTFVLAEGMEVLSADLKNGLLLIDLVRPEPQRVVKTVNITNRD